MGAPYLRLSVANRRIATGAAAGIEAPIEDFRSLCVRQVQTLDAHLSPLWNDSDALNHPRLCLPNHTGVELLADMVEHVFYGRGEVCVLKKLANLAQIAACLEVKQGGRRCRMLDKAKGGSRCRSRNSRRRLKDNRGAVHG